MFFLGSAGLKLGLVKAFHLDKFRPRIRDSRPQETAVGRGKTLCGRT